MSPWRRYMAWYLGSPRLGFGSLAERALEMAYWVSVGMEFDRSPAWLIRKLRASGGGA